MTTRADIQPVPLSLVESDLAEAARRLGDSFRRTGFAVIEGHGIPDDGIEAAKAAARACFALPEAEKRRYHQAGGAGQRGYTPFGVETAKGATLSDLKEFWHVGRDLPEGHRFSATMPPNIWPDDSVPEFRPAMQALFAALDTAGRRVLRAIAVHLNQPADFFDSPVQDGNSILRLLHYPPVSPDADAVRAGAHEDINVITLLLGAEEAGLELLSRDGEWLAVPVTPGSLVVNVGDMLQRQTGRQLPSTTHRVVNPAPERRHLSRYSMPFFLHYRPDWLIEPFVGDEPPITAHDFLLQRLAEIKLA
ncbi:isopenicillin N synthase family dioxygenase [Sandaracinobacteroides hominis]|uniref:isopenicillin N synthase family dioxygenase n=1 Tax=Sandaracinobacteroides hominis TaxID=2780086 RepID=UPI0018F53FEF|nr:isopenicillin N synthase family oxygenase [Sandaracinobacteroides hominis]